MTMSSGVTQTVHSGSGLTTWPMLLDLSRDDCKRSLRSIELQAYASVVSAFRAQGDLTKDKKKALLDLQRLLSVSTERHRAEVRRAVNDEKLATIADHISGPSVTCDWLIEGRRLVPLMPRLVPQTAFTVAANHTSLLQAEKNAQMPCPGLTVTHNIGGCIIKEDDDLLPVPVAAASADRRWQSQQAFTGVHNASGGSGDASTAGTTSSPAGTMTGCVLTKAPVVTTKVVSPAGVQTPMKVTVPKAQLSSGAAQKLILVNASHTAAATASTGGGSTPGKSLTSQTVTLTKPMGGAGMQKTSVVYPAAQAHSPATSGTGAGSAGSIGAQQQHQNSYTHSLTIARPRPKTVAGPSVAAVGPACTTAQSVSITTTSAPRLRMPGPAALSPTVTTSVVHPKPGSGGSTIMATAGPQPVSPAAGTSPRPSMVTSAISITAKPGIQIKQEGAMKIITSSNSKQLLPKAAGSAPPIVVVTSTTATAPSAVTAGSSVNATVVRSITAGGQVQVSGGKVISLGGCKVGSAASQATAASPGATISMPPTSLVSGGKAGASIIAQGATTAGSCGAAAAPKTPASPVLSVTRTSPAVAHAAAASTMGSGSSPSSVKGCTVVVQNQLPRQVSAMAAAASSSSTATSSVLPSRTVKAGEGTIPQPHSDQSVLASPAAANATATVTNRVVTEARPTAPAASVSKSEGAADLAIVARPSILAGLMQSDPAAATVHAPSSHLVLDQAACESISGAPGALATASGEELWLLTSDGSGSDQATVAEAGSGSHADGTDSVADAGVNSVDASGPDPNNEASSSQASAPQFDIFSSALAEAQIDLDPYEYSDDVSTATEDAVPTWAATVAPRELITVVEGLALHNSDASGCIVSDDGSSGTSALLAGTDTCVTAVVVSEYQEVSEEFVEAISQCAAVAAASGDEGAGLAMADDSAGVVAATAATSDNAGLVSDIAGLVSANAAASAVAPVADDIPTGVVPPTHEQPPPQLPIAGSDLLLNDSSLSASAYDVLQIPTAGISIGSQVGFVGDVVCQGPDSTSGSAAECADMPPALTAQVDSPSCAAATAAEAEAAAATTLSCSATAAEAEAAYVTTKDDQPPVADQAGIDIMPCSLVTTTALSSVAAVSFTSVPDGGGDISDTMQPPAVSPSASMASFTIASDASSTSSCEAGAVTQRAAYGPAGASAASSTAGRSDEPTAVGMAGVMQQRKRRTVDSLVSDESMPLTASAAWVKSALGLMHKVMKFRGANRGKGEHNASAWFLRPVTDEEAPGYSAVVTTPMDFGTIKRKLETGSYACSGGLGEFHADMLLVQTNCRLYNPPEHCVRRDCDEVMAYYEREFERAFGRPALTTPLAATHSGILPAVPAVRSAAGTEQVLSPKRMRMSSHDGGSTT